jgi:hypothetical protein
LDLPLCSYCAQRRRRNIVVSFLCFFGFMTCLGIGGWSLWRHESGATAWLVAAAVTLGFLFAWAMKIQIAVARKLDDRYARLAKMGDGFLRRMPPWPYD